MDTVQARTNMVDNQLKTNRIDDPTVLAAMGAVPRELFLPKALHGVAYADEDLLLPDGQFVIEPLVFARLLQAAAIGRDDIVLVVGCDT
ncbi:MAG: protein-L-isoaspartate O-methyltransferase, partial [Alphaproteobacteria bacterium]|nr:protein-L-isoaspartate O-methyltransferase [Alphaproteobacteria bacterium]